MKATVELIISLAFLGYLIVISYFAIVNGIAIESLANLSINEWMPKREWVCFDHSGEFDSLFALRNIGEGLKFLGLVQLVGCLMIACFSLYAHMKRRRQ